MPKITVLMPVYNGEKYLCEAIESVLGQSFKNFEFLIVDDGSTDGSAEIIKSYKDGRIKYVSNGTNLGLPTSLNLGLQLAKGEYVARMDCDDVCQPRRLEKQIAFMKKNADVSVCGTWVKTIGDNSGFVNKYFTGSSDIKASLLFNTSLAHPSVMIRKSVLDRYCLHYDNKHLHFEDYNLWVELSLHSLLANLPEVLLFYRTHNKSVSNIHSLEQKEGASLVRRKQLERLGLTPGEEDMRIHNSLRPQKPEDTRNFMEKEEKWLIRILEANQKNKIYNEDSLFKIIYMRWYAICGLNSKRGLDVWKKFVQSPLFQTYKKNKNYDSAKIFLKSILKI